MDVASGQTILELNHAIWQLTQSAVLKAPSQLHSEIASTPKTNEVTLQGPGAGYISDNLSNILKETTSLSYRTILSRDKGEEGNQIKGRAAEGSGHR